MQIVLVTPAKSPKMWWSIGSVGSLCREGKVTMSETSAIALNAQKIRPVPASPRKGSEP